MERLTYKGTPYMSEEGMITPVYCDYPLRRIMSKLADYEDAEEQGLLLKLPCPIGSEVWKVVNQRDNFSDIPYKITTRTYFRLDMLDEIGKTVFITEKEANNSLAKLNN